MAKRLASTCPPAPPPIAETSVKLLVVVCCAQPATAGNKAQVAPNGLGKVESSVSYGTLSEAKEPPPLGVLSTTSDSIPAAGVFIVTPVGWPPSTVNIATQPSPATCPATNFCTVTSQFYVGGYKATVRSYVTGGAIADNADLELKIPITPAACASYDADSDIVKLSETLGELQESALYDDVSESGVVWLPG